MKVVKEKRTQNDKMNLLELTQKRGRGWYHEEEKGWTSSTDQTLELWDEYSLSSLTHNLVGRVFTSAS